MRFAARTIVALAAVLYALIVIALPGPFFWGTDSGNKAIQAENFARHGAGALTIEYPARDIDPELRWFPTGGHHFQIRDARALSFYPPYLPLAAQPLVRLGGLTAIRWLPMTGAVLALIAVASLARRLTVDPAVAVAAVAFATPVAFYAVDFWEQPLALLFVTVSIGLASSSSRVRDLLIAGAAMSAGIIFREEAYIALAATAIAIGVVRRAFRPAIVFAAGAFPLLAILWLFQWRAWGHPLGAHAAIYAGFTEGTGLAGELAARFQNVYTFLLEFHRDWRLSLLAALPLVALTVFAGRRTPKSDVARVIMLAAWAAASTALAVSMFRDPEPLTGTLYRQGLMPAVPFLALLFAFGRNSGNAASRIALFAAALSVLAITLALNQRDIGVIWGPRHYVPVLAPLAVGAIAGGFGLCRRLSGRWRAAAVATVTWLLLVSAAIQVFGVSLLFRKTRHAERVAAAIAQTGDNAIVTDVFWLPEEMAALYFEKKLLFVRSDAELLALITRLRERGISRFTFVASRRYRLLTPGGLTVVLPHAQQRVRVVSGADPLLDVMVIPVRMPR